MAIIRDYSKNAAGIYVGLRPIYSDFSNQVLTGGSSNVETGLKSYAVAAGHGLFAGCKIIIESLIEADENTANAKVFRVKIGSSSFASPSVASTLSIQRRTVIPIVSLTSQVFFPAGSQAATGATGSAMATLSVDLTNGFTISTTGQIATTTEHLRDRAFDVSFWYPPQ